MRIPYVEVGFSCQFVYVCHAKKLVLYFTFPYLAFVFVICEKFTGFMEIEGKFVIDCHEQRAQ